MKKSREILTGVHFMNGDEASAEGAISVGCRFFAGYPITPATEIAERMSLPTRWAIDRRTSFETEIFSSLAISPRRFAIDWESNPEKLIDSHLSLSERMFFSLQSSIVA